MIDDKTKKELLKDLKINMKALGIPVGAAEVFADKILSEVSKSIKGKKIITTEDLNLYIASSAKKYNGDLAYVYKNRGRII